MDREEIRYLLGSTIYARAKAYENRVQDLECETAENGVRHLSADVRDSGRNLYRTQAWLRQNGSFVSASCTCPFNENGEGPCCKHIGALLLHEVDEPEEKTESKPEKKFLRPHIRDGFIASPFPAEQHLETGDIAILPGCGFFSKFCPALHARDVQQRLLFRF